MVTLSPSYSASRISPLFAVLTAIALIPTESPAQNAPVLNSPGFQTLPGTAAESGLATDPAEASKLMGELSEKLRRQQENERRAAEQDERSEDEQSALAPEDSPDSSLPQRDTLSIYEKMIRGEIIDPDEVLKSLTVFGHSVFAAGRSASSSNDQLSVPADYPIAPGDEILITVWGRINEKHRIIVDRDGKASLPRIGPVAVAGLPFDVMQKNIVTRMENIEGVNAAVTMGQLHSIRVFIVGEVRRPGQYTLSALSNPTNALFAAGGVTKRGSLRNVRLARNGKTVTTLDFYDFLQAGNNFSRIRLKSGDVLVVPVVKNMAAVAGNVRRSGLYEFTEGTTLSDIITLAGGLTPSSWLNRLQVERFEENEYQMVLDLELADSASLPAFTIKDADIVKVFPVLIRDRNAVYLSGNVMRPGKYELKEGMRISSILPDFGALKPETYFQYAVIKRLVPPSHAERLLSFNLQNAIENPGGPDDLPLQAQDNLIIYHRDRFEPDRSVSLAGAVNQPGKFDLLENMRLKDLILEGGGLTDRASIDRGELYRRVFEGDTVSTRKIAFCVECAMVDDPSHNLELQKFDRVYIRPKPGWEEERTIALQGEIVYPGTYVIMKGETLSDVIDRAGGFTPDAHLEAAIFTRESVKKMEKERNRQYIRQLESDIMKVSAEMASKDDPREARVVLDQQLALLERLRELESTGRIVVDLTHRPSYEQFTLEGGDTLHVPSKLYTVSVLGEVYNPSTFQLNPDKRRAEHYLSIAGGMKDGANRKDIYVIRANGSVVSERRGRMLRYELSPGDVIVVPPKIRHVSGYRVFMDTIDAIYKVAVTAGVVIALQR
jgi:protein involved in polysaccharide export with SLBB domain